MKSAKMKPLSPIMERHTPQHPLPDELKQMPKDATVCQFCGVSYLIHHEIKKLEDKVKSLEEQLEYLEGSAEREDKLKDELEKHKNAMVAMNCVISEKDLTIENITKEVDILKQNSSNLRSQLNLEVERKNKTTEKFCAFKLQTTTVLKQFQHEMKMIKSVLNHLRSDVEPLQNQSVQFTEEMSLVLQDFAAKCKNEFNFISNKKNIYETETLSLHKEIKSLKSEAIENKSRIDNLLNDDAKRKETNNQEIEILRLKIQELENSNKDHMQSIKTSEAKFKTLQSDQVLLEDKLRKKQSESQGAIVKLQKTEENANLTIQRLTQECRQLERELSSANQQLEREVQTQKEREKKEREIKERVNLGVGKLDEMEKVLKESKETCKALINERELMITSHQNQIHQLRENFKKKLKASETNPIHSQTQLKDAQQHHLAAITELEKKLKEDFQIELSVEKDKQSEAILSSRNKNQAKIKEMKENLQNKLETYKHEVDNLNQKVEIMRKNMNDVKIEFNEEKSSLKKIISDLEDRIAQLNLNQDDDNSVQKIQLENLKQKLEKVENKNEDLEKELLTTKEEITLLQETVRRECEERFELTEALGTATQQLQTYKSSNVTSNSTHSQVPISALNRVISTGHSDKESIKLSNQTLRNLGLDHPSPRGLPSLRSLPDLLPRRDVTALKTTPPQELSAHIRDLSFGANENLIKRSHSTGSPGNLTSNFQNGTQHTKSAESVDNVRKRIAAAIKRK